MYSEPKQVKARALALAHAVKLQPAAFDGIERAPENVGESDFERATPVSKWPDHASVRVY